MYEVRKENGNHKRKGFTKRGREETLGEKKNRLTGCRGCVVCGVGLTKRKRTFRWALIGIVVEEITK